MRIPALGRAVNARAVCLLATVSGLAARALAYTHPRASTTLQEPDTIKANLDREP